VLGIGFPGKRVQQRIEIGANPQPKMAEVVARVDDRGNSIGSHDLRQAQHQLCPSDSAGENDNIVAH